MSRTNSKYSGEFKIEVVEYMLGEKLPEKDLREFLSPYLTDYMIPEQLISMERFPVMANGKLDRKGLPQLPRIGDYNGGYVDKAKITIDGIKTNPA
jgi:non-ribosomal peptide synthetase component E (peptide arylation enzyme)